MPHIDIPKIIIVGKICSILGQSIPRSTAPNMYILYSSTKHALRVISDGLRQEMTANKHNIKVTVSNLITYLCFENALNLLQV